MKLPKNHILIEANLSQTGRVKIRGIELLSAKVYSDNWREKTPVIATVKQGNETLPDGSVVVCNYWLLDPESPSLLYDNVFSIPCDDMIIALVKEDGWLKPLFGNILVHRKDQEYFLPVPDHIKKPSIDKVIIAHDSEEYKEGDEVFTLKFAPYEIVYNWHGEIRRLHKIHSTDIVGIVEK